jgi:hypothetical protein
MARKRTDARHGRSRTSVADALPEFAVSGVVGRTKRNGCGRRTFSRHPSRERPRIPHSRSIGTQPSGRHCIPTEISPWRISMKKLVLMMTAAGSCSPAEPRVQMHNGHSATAFAGSVMRLLKWRVINTSRQTRGICYGLRIRDGTAAAWRQDCAAQGSTLLTLCARTELGQVSEMSNGSSPTLPPHRS